MKASFTVLMTVALSLFTTGLFASPIDHAADAAPSRRGNDILARVAHVETSTINSKRNVHEEIPDLRRGVHEEIPDLRRGEHGDIPQLG